MISNKVYDVLKDISLCWMPMLVTFVGVVLATVHAPHAVAIMTILTAANAALGEVVKYYKSRYDEENK